MIQAAIFDMDGTLFDSEPVYLEVWQRTSAEFGFELMRELYLTTVGMTLEAAYETLEHAFGETFPSSEFQRLWPERWRSHVLRYGMRFKPGVLELLGMLEGAKLKRAVATSSHGGEALLLLGEAGLLTRFQAVVTGDEVRRGKPYPDIYLEAARRLGVAPEACLAFEDSTAGATAALDAGITTFIIPDLLQPSEAVRLRAAGVLPSLKAALGPVRALLGR